MAPALHRLGRVRPLEYKAAHLAGIGLSLAVAMMAAGAARVVLWDIDAAALDRAVAGLRAQGRAADGIVVDLSQPAAIAAAVAATEALGALVGRARVTCEPLDMDRHERIVARCAARRGGAIWARRWSRPASGWRSSRATR